MREWRNDRGEGKIQGMEFMDSYGTMIEATIFNADIDKFIPVLKEGGVYVISNANVKVANQKFARVKGDFCLNFHQNTSIKPCDDDVHIGKRGFVTTQISKLFALAPSPNNVDILAIVT